MRANTELTEELNRLDREIESLMAEQSGAFQTYMRTAQDLRRALRQTVQLSNQEWVERISSTTRRLKRDMDAIELNDIALGFVGRNAEQAGLQDLESIQETTIDRHL